MKHFLLHRLLTAALFLFAFVIVQGAWGQVSLTTINTSYSQDFNTLASTGTSSTVPAGFSFVESGNAANTNETYTAGTGSSTTGETYSFGATNATERAFGGLRSANVIPTIGASFVNNTTTTITSLSITYTGEQWRLGMMNRVDRLDFQYSTTATSLTSTTGYVDVNGLDFTAPITTGTVGLIDGNAVANRTTLTSTITGLSIAPGATFRIRYIDFDATGSDDGLAIDDFSLTPIGVAVCPTITASLNGTTTICTGSSTNLTATITGGTGPYSLTYSDGTNNTVVNPYTSGTNILVNPTATTTYSIVGVTDANACPGTASGMSATVTVNSPPTVSNAGSSQTVTTGNSATLAANTPTSGTGSWSVASGPSTVLTQFSSTTNPTAMFTPAGGVGDYVLTWT